MLTEKMIKLLGTGLQRVFAMQITRSTFREIQTVIITSTSQDKDLGTQVFDALFSGKVKTSLVEDKKLQEKMKIIVNHFGVLVRLAKEVYERGEFVNIITSDTLSYEEKTVFLNRIRRIDGSEFQFITDPESTIHLLHHFTNRLQEMQDKEDTRKALSEYKNELQALRDKITGATTV